MRGFAGFARDGWTYRPRTFVHVEGIADAVAGAVALVDALGPDRRAGERIELLAGRAARKARPRQRDHALEYQRVVAALFVGQSGPARSCA